jgi:uncharacterized protein YndB with AHSA1/START domain
MPTASRSRTIAASVEELWEVVRDPHHLPRWWPRVSRVEDVEGDEFTEVLKTAKGKIVRADFQLVEADECARRISWTQRVGGTPFERLLKSAETEVRLRELTAREEEASTSSLASPTPSSSPRSSALPSSAGASTTEVTIELRQVLHGVFPRIGGYMVRCAARKTIDEALDGLERIGG